MSLLPLRLHPGDDLRRSLELAVQQGTFSSAFVVAGIGSLRGAKLRFADRIEPTVFAGSTEILSLTGTLSESGAHLHMSIATESGQVFGGHVVIGNEIRTTAEILLAPLPDWQLRRELDPATGFAELVVRRRS